MMYVHVFLGTHGDTTNLHLVCRNCTLVENQHCFLCEILLLLHTQKVTQHQSVFHTGYDVHINVAL